MKYEALFLDMDGTFLDFHAAERDAFYQALSEAGLEPGPELYEAYSALNDSLWKAFEREEIEKQDIRNRRFGLLFDRYRLEADGLWVEKLYEKYLAKGHALMPGAYKVLEQLYEKYPLYAVTNGFAAVQRNRLQMSGIARFMKQLFISEEIGCQKPQKEFFDYCFANIQLPLAAGNVLLVGDSLTSDIRGAVQSGIRSCWYNPSGKPNESAWTADYEIRSLKELTGMLL